MLLKMMPTFSAYMFFINIFWRTLVLFVEPLILLFWISGEVYPGFQSQDSPPHLHALSPAHDGLFRFISGVTSADLLVANMAAELFWSMYLCMYEYWWGLSPRLKSKTKRATASQHVTRQMLYLLSYASSAFFLLIFYLPSSTRAKHEHQQLCCCWT